MSRKATPKTTATSPRNPTWYKEALIYEIHIRAFYDSNGDGIGDLKGLTQKLDYLQDLGVTALWLLPFYPSPLRDGGYDIADYTDIHPSYGTLNDFRMLLREAHRRGLRVITELVLNHTSSEHAWFQRARTSPPASSYRNYYVWSDTPNRYRDARIIFKDFEHSNWTWDPVAKAYYWHRFYSHQPDLNFENPAVQRELLRVVNFWLALGVDGLRLDAVPYLYEQEGTICENLEATHAFLKKLRAHIDERFPDRMLLAEANQWPVDAAAYFGNGDECHMNFHFPLMPRMFMAVQLEDRFPIIDILRQTPQIPASCQWATFLRNHDELTLEMVTDEERDYMYRMFAEDPVARINLGIRRRLSPLLRNRRKIELMNALLFALPGTPVMYYGDEIGMGDNIHLGDRDGVRTPMQWSGDLNAGFSRAPAQLLYLPVVTDPEYHYASVNVEALQRNPSSLLWWMKRLIALRQRHPVFGHGSLRFINTDNHRVLAFVRGDQDENILVAANLSRFPQHATLDLSEYQGRIPVEMFGRTRFPLAQDGKFFLSFGPHSFYWFLLAPDRASVSHSHGTESNSLRIPSSLRELVAQPSRELLRALQDHLVARRYFRSKARTISNVSVEDVFSLPHSADHAQLLLVKVCYIEGEAETYLLGVALALGSEAAAMARTFPHAAIARVETTATGADGTGLLYDPLSVPALGDTLLSLIRSRRGMDGTHGELVTVPLGKFPSVDAAQHAAARAPQLEQSNSTFLFGEKLFLKIYRLAEAGTNPEVELGNYLGRQSDMSCTPGLVAALEYRVRGKPTTTLASMQEYVPNQGTAWQLALDAILRCFERAVTDHSQKALERPPKSWMARATAPVPEPIQQLLGSMLPYARMLGLRTADLHSALSRSTEPDFAPIPFSAMHQQSVYQRARTMLVRTLEQLQANLKNLPPHTLDLATAAISREAAIEARLHRIVESRVDAVLIRHHGDLHLGQVLCTGDGFVIIDFEGEPARPLHERRYKRGSLRDVTGMLRSFHYAAAVALRDSRVRREDFAALATTAKAWQEWVSAAYLGAYLSAAPSSLLPADPAVRELLVDFYGMEKCIYELGYELNNRPHWLDVPLTGLLEVLEKDVVES